MKKIHYRIVADKYGYYPQTLTKKTYLFGLITKYKWLRIAKHLNGFGLYNDLGHSLSDVAKCELLIESYHSETIREIKKSNNTVAVIKHITKY